MFSWDGNFEMSDTLPPEIERRIRVETEIALHKAADDRGFREEMLRLTTRMAVTIEHIAERQRQHELEDERKFARIGMSIDGALTLRQVTWTLAGISATVATFWGIIELVGRVTP